MKKQRILSFLLALAMTFSLMPAGAMAVRTEDFTDVSKSDWFYKYVDFVTDEKYFVGTSEDTFSPEMSMTRAMFVVVLAALEGAKVDNNVSPFADVPANTWYSGAVKWAADKGVVAGVGDNKFAPDAAISREQMAVMMDAYVKWHAKNSGETHKLKSKIDSFADADEISSWAAKSVEACRKWGLIAGAPDGNYYPQNTSTRAEVATVIYNLAWLVYGGGSVGGETPGCSHVDADKNHKCDLCGTAMGGACADSDNDHKCDYCGKELSVCEDKNNDHKCDVCSTAMCPGEDLIYNALVASAKDVKAALKEKGQLVTDATELDEAVIAKLDDLGVLDLLDYSLENGTGLVSFGGNDTYTKFTATNLGENQCRVCAGGSASHPITVDTVLSLEKSTAKDIIDATGLTYEMAIDAAKTLLAGAGYSLAAMTKEEAIQIAKDLAAKFEAETGIPVSKETVKKAVDKLMAAPDAAKDAANTAIDKAAAVWTKNFKNDKGYVTGDVVFTVNDTSVTVKVDTETYLEGSKKDAIVNLAMAIAKDLYGDLKNNAPDWKTLPEITADKKFGFEASVKFTTPANDNAVDTVCFADTYSVAFTFTALGDVFDYVEYKYDTMHSVKVIIPDAAKDAYTAAANKIIQKVLAMAASIFMPSGTSVMAVADDYSSSVFLAVSEDGTTRESSMFLAPQLPAFSFNSAMEEAMNQWLAGNLTDGNMVDSPLMNYINGTGSADELNHEALYEFIDNTLESKLVEQFGTDGDFADLATQTQDQLVAKLQTAIGEENYTKLKDMGLDEYVIAKTRDFVDPTDEEGKYTTDTVIADMKQNVNQAVKDVIDETIADPEAALPGVPGTVGMYLKAMDTLSQVSTFDGMASANFGKLADVLTNATFQGLVGEHGNSIVDRACDFIGYIPESASISIGSYSIAGDELDALRDSTTTVDACNNLAALIDNFDGLQLADFDNNDEGQVITVGFAGKSVSFRLVIDMFR